jgi:hypothetical protein
MPKIIFSRKGFDSTYGKGASAIMPNGDLISFPIPVNNEKYPHEKGIPYTEVFYQNKSYQEWMQELGLPHYDFCHLDPDLIHSAYPRKTGWNGIFGQAGAAAKHLKNQGVSVGDIFLFFGSFQKTYKKGIRIHFYKEAEQHILFGFLKVGAIYEQEDFYQIQHIFGEHPHLQNHKSETASYVNNTVYVAKNKKDYGVFQFNRNLVLTRDGFSKSFWELPAFFYDEQVGITYHKVEKYEKLNDKMIFKTVGRGQEFVVDEHPKVTEWAENLIATSNKIE